MITFTQRVRRDNVRISSVIGSQSPDWPDSTPWRVTLRRKGRQCTVNFFMGPALCREPEAAEVLHCLISDALSWENASDLDDFMSEFGYGEDSRPYARRVFRACERTSRRVRAFLGDDFDAYVSDTVWDV